jgi:hypothetical protein
MALLGTFRVSNGSRRSACTQQLLNNNNNNNLRNLSNMQQHMHLLHSQVFGVVGYVIVGYNESRSEQCN